MKTTLILLLYDMLLGGKAVSRAEFCEEHSLSERTFYRYLREVSAFLRTYKADCVVDMADREGRYFLKKV